MKFDSNHKVLLDSLVGTEVDAYIDFLHAERMRHQSEIKKCTEMVEKPYSNDLYYDHAMREFYGSALNRHNEDIRQIDELLGKLGLN